MMSHQPHQSVNFTILVIFGSLLLIKLFHFAMHLIYVYPLLTPPTMGITTRNSAIKDKPSKSTTTLKP
jgi:hypothetical protein